MPDIPVEVKKLKDLDYFHPDLDRHKAECILLQNGTDGTFLIRNSSQPNEYVVSVKSQDAVKHFQLFWRNDHFEFGHGTYQNLEELAYHFSNKPLLGGDSGQTTLLVDTYPRKVSEPTIYDTVRVHAEYNTGETAHRTDFSINSKDGYLTKLGAIFKINSKDGYLTKLGGILKTWKVRWFVIQNNELKYFKNSSDKFPVRVLDLNECKACEMEPAPFRGKPHVFRLEFAWRTFYIFAATQQESQEWIKLIKWRLENKA